MIVVDIETSGGNLLASGIWQIGAIDLDSNTEFLEEARIDDEDTCEEIALRIGGKTEAELRDKKKQSQKQMLESFFKWVEGKKIKNMVSQCPQCLDHPLVLLKAQKYGLKFPFPYRAFDLHSIASLKYYQVYGKFLIKEDKSELGLSNICAFCGLPDERIATNDNKVIREGKPHNALEDCKMEAECFSRIVYGKCLLEEYAKFPIPEYLK